MLYIWPYIAFFSWPVLIPTLLPVLLAILPNRLLCLFPLSVRSSRSHLQRLPRLRIIIPIILLTLSIIHFDTVVHPYELADNRHYTFYVFRALRRHPIFKYLAAPVYVFLAWACIYAMAGVPMMETPNPRIQGSKTRPSDRNFSQKETRVSDVIFWLVVCTLCLATAPLVEPRYSIVPWLVWRLRVPILPPSLMSGELLTLVSSNKPVSKSRKQPFPRAGFHWAYFNMRWILLGLETFWSLVVNSIIGYVFLMRGFEWVDNEAEEGKIQRFMW